MLPSVNLKLTLLLCTNLPSKTVVLNESNFAPQVIIESRASGLGQPPQTGQRLKRPKISTALRLRNLRVRNDRGGLTGCSNRILGDDFPAGVKSLRSFPNV